MTNYIKYSTRENRFKGYNMKNSGVFRKERCQYCNGKKFKSMKTEYKGRFFENNKRCNECSGIGYVFVEEDI